MVISLTAKGLTTGEVQAHLAETYGTEVSRETISKITDRVLDDLAEWANRPLDRVYPCHEVVKVEYHLPGCPPSADTLWEALNALLEGRSLELPYELIKYD